MEAAAVRRTGFPPIRHRLAIAFVAVALSAYAAPALAGQAPLAIPLPAPFPPVKLLTVLIALHLVGLCFGLGGATMLDFWILRWMRWGGMPGAIARMFEFISKVTAVGIGLLWLSGIGFVALYAVESPEKLSNPKMWAKVAIVFSLTVNGLLIHALVLPKVLHDVRRPILDGFSHASAGFFLVSGAISAVSWYAAFALGVLRELNGIVPASVILTSWFIAVAVASIGAYVLWRCLKLVTALHRAPFLPPLEAIRGLSAGLPDGVKRVIHGWRENAPAYARKPAHGAALERSDDRAA